jgi:hypothetical protein
MKKFIGNKRVEINEKFRLQSYISDAHISQDTRL